MSKLSHNSTVRIDIKGNVSKSCGKCKEHLPAAAFNADKTRVSHGLQNWCRDCKHTWAKVYYSENRDRYRAHRATPRGRANSRRWSKENRLRRRAAMFEHYGHICACCGENDKDFLTLDHMNEDGAAHRRALGGNEKVMSFLEREGWPVGYQILCFNCNAAKYIRRGCPHNKIDWTLFVGACA